MNVKALAIMLGDIRAGLLFQYPLSHDFVINRFVPEREFFGGDHASTRQVLSQAFVSDDPQRQASLLADVTLAEFNGLLSADRTHWLLPAFFQNLLPEGVFRDHIAELRNCAPNDHFEMLAACGEDLPGKVYARPVQLSRDDLSRYITQNNDALEMTVTADPIEGGVSLSGVQPKIGVTLQGGRYVARTRFNDTSVIAKLPVSTAPKMPEVEDLSLRLAKAAGVDTCEASLEPLDKLMADHGYQLGDVTLQTNFLAVKRFDREAAPVGEDGQPTRKATRIHVEDFAQVLDVPPERKYGDEETTYLDIAAVLMAIPSLGEPAVHELLRRMMVNELLGNPDMHLKNIGLIYRDGVTPQLSPAYDIVAHCVFNKIRGHGLRIMPAEASKGIPPETARFMRKPVLIKFCDLLQIPFKSAEKTIRQTVRLASSKWPAMIAESTLELTQKEKLAEHLKRQLQALALKRD